ncbi:hypothetical protein J5X98_01955 [Leptothermofonsia sichuanensis E412]|nr:hypothetical protein [Leptothermofonsia sichuanensis]QZZ21278.1 hypothetical protein J5X98_01955 [Leptothermofonsia sichuanensis E412]
MPPKTMPLAAHIYSLQTLILSFHPLIVVETVEEEGYKTSCKQQFRI